MKKYTVSNASNTLEVSQLALGHLNMHLAEKQETAFGYMEEFLELGGNVFDNSRNTMDGQSEKALGKFIKKTGKREKILVATKVAHHDKKYYSPRVTPANIATDVDTSLMTIGTDYIDILYLHRDDISRPVEEIMVALDKIVKSGKARVLGASNWSVTRLQAANDFAKEYGLTPFSISQINYSLGLTIAAVWGDLTQIAMTEAEKSWYEASDMLLMPYTPNARGFFTQVVETGKAKARTHELYGWCPENYKRAERVKELSQKTGHSAGAIVLAYLLNQEIDISPIIAFSKKEQFAEAKLALDCVLSKEELSFLEGK